MFINIITKKIKKVIENAKSMDIILSSEDIDILNSYSNRKNLIRQSLRTREENY